MPIVMPIIRDYRSKIASNSFTGKVNTRDFSARFHSSRPNFAIASGIESRIMDYSSAEKFDDNV